MDEPCRCFEDIEKNLERIVAWPHFGFVKWAHGSAFIEVKKHSGAPGDTKSPYVSVNKICNLPSAIKELADKIDPPKPDEREWRVGDVVQAIRSSGIAKETLAIVERLSGHDSVRLNLKREGS